MKNEKLEKAKQIVDMYIPFHMLPPKTQLCFTDLVTGRLNKVNVHQLRYTRKKKGLIDEAWKCGLACTLYDLYLDILETEGA